VQRGDLACLRYYPNIRLGGRRKIKINPSQDSRSSGRDSNLGPLKFKIRVITTGSRRSSIKFTSKYSGP
jgi:hypothetical protein